jgi:hypothetical protein
MHTPFGKSFEKNMRSPNGLIKRNHGNGTWGVLKVFIQQYWPSSVTFQARRRLKKRRTCPSTGTIQTGAPHWSGQCQQRHQHLFDGQEGKEEKDQGKKDLEEWSFKLLDQGTWGSQIREWPLVCKYDSVTRQYDKVIKSFACVAAVDQVN